MILTNQDTTSLKNNIQTDSIQIFQLKSIIEIEYKIDDSSFEPFENKPFINSSLNTNIY